jgi:hypothetical protein
MGLYFRNGTNVRLWVVIGYPNSSCAGEGTGVTYSKRGWYFADPRQTIKCWTGWVGGHASFYYAETDDFSRAWRGDYHTGVPDNSFDDCWGLDTSAPGRRLGFRRVRPDADVMDHTVRLIL